MLHSRAASTRKIFLDFDGHTTTNTNWNGLANISVIVTPAYNKDSNISTFSLEEQADIIAMWRAVAEDYAMFDVDVTTEDPGIEALRKTDALDVNYGIRVCIGGSSYDWYGKGAGGTAYLGSFTWNSDTPTFVFPAQLGPNVPKYVWEAISHETGHTLGLSHDGDATKTYYQGGLEHQLLQCTADAPVGRCPAAV